jgi:mono/diheme cytochrome c family protein
MKTLQMMAGIVATSSVLTLLAVASARGQTAEVLSANVPFAFEAGGTSLPAGPYQFKFQPGERSLVISGAKAGDMKLPIISHIYGASLFKYTGLVFDTVEGHHVISEIWFGEGGMLVNATPVERTPEMVMAVVSGAAPKMSGKEVFARTCARCHGAQGEGKAEADMFFQMEIPRLNSKVLKAKSDDELRDIITHGRSKMDPVRTGQATLQHNLYPESVDAVISYLRGLKEH